MRILVICQYYYPEEFRINDICEQLAKSGNEIKVITGLPNYPSGIISKEFRFFRKRKEIRNNVEILRTFEIGRGKGKFKLFLNYLSFMISSTLKVLTLNDKFDVVFVYQLSPVTMILPGLVYKKVFNVPLIIYSCDLWPASILNYIKDKDNFVFQVTDKMSKWLYKSGDKLIVSSKSFIEYFSTELNISKSKLYYLPSYAEEFYTKLGNRIDNGILDFLFAGNIGAAQDLETLINAIELIKNKDTIMFHIVGDGSNLENIKKLCTKKNLSKYIRFYGRKSLKEIEPLYKLADVCLVLLKNNSEIGLTLPSKVQSYMAAGKTIIGAIDGQTNEIINLNNIGICVKSSCIGDLAKAIQSIIDNPELISEYESNSFKYYKNNFSMEQFIEKLINHMKQLKGE